MKNNNELKNKVNFKQILKEVITGQDYDNPEELLNKSEKILNFLKNSSNENDRKEYRIIMSKIQTDHNLKALFDYFFKRKRQERLKLFMMMQIQNRGKAIRKIKKEKNKGFADEMTEEELEEFKKYQKLQHEAFLLLELEQHLEKSSKEFIVELPKYKNVSNEGLEKKPNNKSIFKKNDIPNETLSNFDFDTKHNNDIRETTKKAKNEDLYNVSNQYYLNKNETYDYDKKTSSVIKQNIEQDFIKDNNYDYGVVKKNQNNIEDNHSNINIVEYVGKYIATFAILTEAYKHFILSKPQDLQEKILGHYEQTNKNKNFDANEFEKSISFVNFRQNLGLKLPFEDNKNLQQNNI